MSYKYTFDSSDATHILKLPKNDYQLLQEGFQSLLTAIKYWNDKCQESGIEYLPYRQEANDLRRMIDWGNDQLRKSTNYSSIIVSGISVGSIRYCKAALIYLEHKKEKEIDAKVHEGWPNGALQPLKEKIDSILNIERSIKYPPADVLWEIMPREEVKTYVEIQKQWDVFISHAHEDKSFVRDLASKLCEEGLNVWFDEFTLRIGDSLRRSIDKGLVASRFGIVVLSHNFFGKEWPQKELDGLVALEADGRKVILPVWHNITVKEILLYSPMLADRVAVSSQNGIDKVVSELKAAIER